MSGRVDAVTSLVEGLLSNPMVNVQPTVYSDFDRLVEPSGIDPRYNLDHTVGGPSVPAVLQCDVSPTNWGNCVFPAVFRAPEVVKGPFFSADINERLKNLIRRSNAVRKSGKSLRFRSSSEYRNPDPRGEDVPVSETDGNPVSSDFDRIDKPVSRDVWSPDPGIQDQSYDFAGDLEHTYDGYIIKRRWAKKF